MRTKTLILAAAVSAAGLATSMAQTVYSVNTVGYVNLVIPPGYSIIANPLMGATNTIPVLFAGAPQGTIIYKYKVDGTYDINNLRPGTLGWAFKDMTLVPGEGVFIFNPSTTTSITNTFVGEVFGGTNVIRQGFSIISSMVPQEGRITTDLGYTTGTGVQSVYLYDSVNGYTIKSTFASGAWIGGEPVIKVGQGFFINVPSQRNWERTYTTGT